MVWLLVQTQPVVFLLAVIPVALLMLWITLLLPQQEMLQILGMLALQKRLGLAVPTHTGVYKNGNIFMERGTLLCIFNH
jgi:hypothetical protein